MHELPTEAKTGSKYIIMFLFGLLFHSTAMLWCWFLFASLSFLSGSLATFGLERFSLLVSKSAPHPPLSAC